MSKKPAKPKPGPKPETLKIDGDWTAAVKKALQKKKPAAGWHEAGRRRQVIRTRDV